MRWIFSAAMTCLVIGACASGADAETLSITPDNVPNWGRVSGRIDRAVKSCPFEVPPRIATVFEWSEAKHGRAFRHDHDVGFIEIDESLAKGKASDVCKSLLATIGPNGSVADSLIVPKTQPPVAPSPPPEKAPLKLTAKQVLDRVGNNELRLRHEAEDADGILLSGKVDNVENGFLGSGPVVTLKVGAYASVMAYLDTSQTPAAEKLNSGDAVTLLCRNPTNIAKGYAAAVYSCFFK